MSSRRCPTGAGASSSPTVRGRRASLDPQCGVVEPCRGSVCECVRGDRCLRGQGRRDRRHGRVRALSRDRIRCLPSFSRGQGHDTRRTSGISASSWAPQERAERIVSRLMQRAVRRHHAHEHELSRPVSRCQRPPGLGGRIDIRVHAGDHRLPAGRTERYALSRSGSS